MSQIISMDHNDPDKKQIKELVEAVKAGKVVAYPTETFYGLGVDVSNETAIKHLFDLKRRDYGNPIAVIVANRDMLSRVVKEVPEIAEPLMDEFWPGPLTILFQTTDKISRKLTTNTGKIGMRVSSDPIASAIVSELGSPLTTTSANVSGHPPSFSAQDVKHYFGDKVDYIIDVDELPPSLGSTVVDVTEEKLVLIREGAFEAKSIFKFVEEDDSLT